MTAHATPERPAAGTTDPSDPDGPETVTPESRPSPPAWSAEEPGDAWGEELSPADAAPSTSTDDWLQGPVESTAGTSPLEDGSAVEEFDTAEIPTGELPVAERDEEEPHLPEEPSPDSPAAPESGPEGDPEDGERWQVVEQTPAEAAPTPAPATPAAPMRAEHEVQAEGVPSAQSDRGPAAQRALPPAAPSAQAPGAGHDPSPSPASRPDAPAGAPAERESHVRPGTLAAALELLSPHLRPQRPALLVGLIALVLGMVALALLPLALRGGLDAATGADPSAVLPAAIVLGVLALLGVGLRALAATALDGAASRAATALRSRLLHHLHRLSPGRDIEDLEGTATPLVEDVASLRDLVGRSGPRLLASLIALVTLLITTLVLAPGLAPVPLVVALLAAGVSALVGRSRRRREDAARKDASALADAAQELLAATRTVQSYGLEDRAAGTLAEAGARAARSRSAARRGRVLGLAAHALVGAAGVLAVLLLGAQQIPDGPTAGDLVAVLAATLAAVPLAHGAVRAVSALSAAVAAAGGLADLLSHTAAIGEPPRTQGVGPLRGEVVFSAITADAPRGPRFDGISVVIPAGQRVALMDRSGAEASALLSYLLRFDQPETGRVLLDRYDTRSLSLADLRGALAVVQREPALFSETVRENIRAGRPGAGDGEVAEAARRSGADTLHSELPDGYETLLVRRGAALTDGRRRRLAIARALLRDAPVVLLDRADAELAPRERAEVLAALDALAEGRTVLVHSRDPETVRGVDRVLWFEDGRLVEDGHPDQLAEDPHSRLSSWLLAAEDPQA